MPRNDQITRQWHLLRLLESPRGGTLDELQSRLPTDYARRARTVRRDLEALEASGFPLLNERVDGQMHWRLMDGARHAPALSFSLTELMALVMSRTILKPLEGTQVQAAVGSAMTKASALLPPASLEYVQHVQNLFAVGLGPHKTYKFHRDTIDRLTQAIDKHRTVQVRYFSASRTRMIRREIDPYRLWYASGGLYLVGYCHLRNEPRLFAVERIKSVYLVFSVCLVHFVHGPEKPDKPGRLNRPENFRERWTSDVTVFAYPARSKFRCADWAGGWGSGRRTGT